MLIADEVGLGKTVEALYIWRELHKLVRRSSAARGMPRRATGKMAGRTAETVFAESEIVDAKRLAALIEETLRDPTKSFIAIAGIEGIRAKTLRSGDDGRRRSTRQALQLLLFDNESGVDFSLFDLVVIDEAHNLRNPETANNHTAAALAAASSHLVLLTATPIQIGSANLFQLLSFIDAERFPSFESFNMVQDANRPVTQALSALLDIPPRDDEFRNALQQIKENPFFRNDDLADELLADATVFTSPELRVQAAHKLESRSLLADVLTRTRKRDVIQNRVVRDPQVVRVGLSAEETELYRRVTKLLRDRAYGSSTSTAFATISRQRQLASSIPAAIEGWREKGVMDEILWEDLGFVPDDDLDTEEIALAPLETKFDFAANDSKYSRLLEILQKIGRGGEKLIIFSFYRGTLSYLERRLRADRFSCSRIVGGMGEQKDQELRRFEDPNGSQILLSSEVGAEGIDLQFARIVVNYDLPWNPMKVEQRIGRIDRLGQVADKIQIVSFVLADTIEELVLDRLYQRIRVFEQSIGDLEEILGESVDEILLEYFRDGLSEEEMSQRLSLNALAAERRRHDEQSLEEQAPDLVGHMDYLLNNIQKSHDFGHWIRPNDMLTYLTEFLERSFVGSKIELDPLAPGLCNVNLGPDARASLQSYIESARPPKLTRMHVPGVVYQRSSNQPSSSKGARGQNISISPIHLCCGRATKSAIGNLILRRQPQSNWIQAGHMHRQVFMCGRPTYGD